MQVTFDPQISELDNLFEVMLRDPAYGGRITRGSETSQYPEEKKPNGIPPVAASERGIGQTGGKWFLPGLWGLNMGLGGIAEWSGKAGQRGW